MEASIPPAEAAPVQANLIKERQILIKEEGRAGLIPGWLMV